MKQNNHPLLWPEFWEKGNELGDQFNHDNVSYDLKLVRRLVRNLPRVLFSVEELKWLLPHCEWTEEDEKRKVYIRRPIFCVNWIDPEDRINKIVVVDGLHRLKRAVDLKMEFLPGIWVPEEVMAAAKI